MISHTYTTQTKAPIPVQEDEWPENYTPTTWIEDGRKDELRDKFNVLIQVLGAYFLYNSTRA